MGVENPAACRIATFPKAAYIAVCTDSHQSEARSMSEILLVMISLSTIIHRLDEWSGKPSHLTLTKLLGWPFGCVTALKPGVPGMPWYLHVLRLLAAPETTLQIAPWAEPILEQYGVCLPRINNLLHKPCGSSHGQSQGTKMVSEMLVIWLLAHCPDDTLATSREMAFRELSILGRSG
jgi:hypothetical protein